MNPKFSLLVANYNNGKYFEECYKSILAQTYGNWEVIIIDDGSADNSVEIIKAVIKNDARCKFYKNETNKGCGYTKHQTVQYATGEICGFIDPDDALLPHAVETIITAFEKNREAVLVHSYLLFCDEKLNKESVYAKAKKADSADKNFFNFDGSVTAFAGFKKSAYEKTGGIDAYMQRAIDQDLYLKLAETGAFVFVNEPLYLYRIHDKSISKLGNWKKAHYWHWVAAMNAAKRRNVNIEEQFVNAFTHKRDADKLNKIISGQADGRFYLKMLLQKLKRKFPGTHA